MLANVGTGFRCAQKGLSEAKSNIFLRAGGVMSTLKLKLLLCCDFRSLGWLIWRARKFSYLMRRCPLLLLLLVIVVDDDDKPPNLYNVGQDCSVPPLCSIFFIYVTPQNIIVPLIRSQKCMTAAVICYAHGENMCPVQTPPILSRQDKLNRGLCKVTTIRTITMGPHVITVKIYEESSEHLRTSGLFHWKHMAINTSKYHVWGFFRIQNYQLKARGFHRFWLPNVEKSLSIQDLGTGLTLSMLPDQAIFSPVVGSFSMSISCWSHVHVQTSFNRNRMVFAKPVIVLDTLW